MRLLCNKRLLLMLLVLCLVTLMVSACGTNEQSAAKEEQQEQENKETEAEKEARLLEEMKAEQERQVEERRQLELTRREQMGDFYVPLPPMDQPENPVVKARGIYLTGNSVGLPDRFQAMLDLIATTELNAVVIDVKNDHGVMSYKSDIAIVQQVGANQSLPIKDVQAVLAELHDREIYTIARVVVFKDPHLAEQRPEWAIQKNSGGIWRDNRGVAWINPYDRHVWDYNIAIAQEAALHGFHEIQFDYVRFPENARRVDREAFYPGENGVAKDDAIESFLRYAREQLADYDIHIAADTFGVIATSWGDSDRIGQTWEKVARQVEYNCPMIYPSHYGEGYFGYAVPDAHPAGVIRRALTDAVKRNAPLENPAIIRPWLQSFTATWIRGHIRYGAAEVRAQIDAALELGIDEYLIWNAGNRYISEAFLSEEEAEAKRKSYEAARAEKNHDVLGRTPHGALTDLLTAFSQKSWREALVLHETDFSIPYDGYRDWMGNWSGTLKSYEIQPMQENKGEGIYIVDLVLTIAQSEQRLEGQNFQVYMENNVWRVKPPEALLDLLTMAATIDEKEGN